MCPHSYYDMIRSDNHKQTLRSQMVHYAREHSVSAAARQVFKHTRQSARQPTGRQLVGTTAVFDRKECQGISPGYRLRGLCLLATPARPRVASKAQERLPVLDPGAIPASNSL